MRVYSILTGGISNDLVEIEFHSRFQIPSFHILGLPAPEIQEARERIMAAFQNSDLEFPKRKVIINLAPASVKKSGTGHDLSIALKILSEVSEMTFPETALAWGELSLDGKVKSTGKMASLLDVLMRNPILENTVLFLSETDHEALILLCRWRQEMRLPLPSALKIQVVEDLKTLSLPLDFHPLNLSNEHENSRVKSALKKEERFLPNLLPLPKTAERVLKLSLIGKHHVLLLGPKGIGKSESIKWYQALLPESKPLQTWQRLLVSEQRGFAPDFEAPVRRVHAQVKPSHLLGSFQERGYLPGELALAHGGLFIADEFMEWPRDSKECLREPLQTQKIFLTRVKGQMECPSDFQMVATGNLCPCGGLPSNFRSDIPLKKFSCKCHPMDVDHYLKKISGPILDRIDLSLIMTETAKTKKSEISLAESKNEIEMARDFSLKNFGAISSELTPDWLEANLPKAQSFEKILEDIHSLRARHKVLRVARSIQALEKSHELREEYVFEAKWYRFSS